jgi:LacI family transcriptional regulator
MGCRVIVMVIAEQTRPALTTIDMELKELGRQAGLAILDLTKGEEIEPGERGIPCRLFDKAAGKGDD